MCRELINFTLLYFSHLPTLNLTKEVHQVCQLVVSCAKNIKGNKIYLIVLGGNFVGQPITSRRVAGATSIAAPIATSITVSVTSDMFCAATVFHTILFYLYFGFVSVYILF